MRKELTASNLAKSNALKNARIISGIFVNVMGRKSAETQLLMTSKELYITLVEMCVRDEAIVKSQLDKQKISYSVLSGYFVLKMKLIVYEKERME